MKKAIILLVFAVAALMGSGCYIGNVPFGAGDHLVGEEYPDAEKYQVGAFTYTADSVNDVEVYWRSGEVRIVESDSPQLSVRESGEELAEDIAMHSLLEDGILRIRFCQSGAEIYVNPSDKYLTLEVPKGIDLSIHTTAAVTRADTLEQNSILISVHSGDTQLGTVTAKEVDLSSSAGGIHADSIFVQKLRCSASSGSVRLDSITADTAEIITSSGNVELTLLEAPTVMIRTSSGDVHAALAEGGALLAYTSGSGQLRTRTAYERRGDLYVFGSGESSLTVETSSGNLEIQ